MATLFQEQVELVKNVPLIPLRELSLAMEEIETIFSLVDSKMLNLRINIFDEKCCTKKEQTSSFRNTRFILDEVSKTYFESFKYAISMAEKGESADKIANRFKRILPTIETLSIDFEKKLS